jgi:hypothetical protein
MMYISIMNDFVKLKQTNIGNLLKLVKIKKPDSIQESGFFNIHTIQCAAIAVFEWSFLTTLHNVGVRRNIPVVLPSLATRGLTFLFQYRTPYL